MENKKREYTYHLIMENGTHGKFIGEGIFNTNPEDGLKSLVVSAMLVDSKLVDVEPIEVEAEEPNLFESQDDEQSV